MTLRPLLLLLLSLLASLAPSIASALAPEEVLVVANGKARESLDLARYYLERRAVPRENLLEIAVTDAETCSRREYETAIAQPVRRYLAGEGGRRIRAVVLLYGVPLRVSPPEPTLEEQIAIAALEGERQEISKHLPSAPEDEKSRLEKRLQAVRSEMSELRKSDQEASVDSELALVRAPEYPLKGWVANPLYVGFAGRPAPLEKGAVLQVSRLDGPTPAVVRRLIDDALDAEREGLQGKAYLDARWKDPGAARSGLSGYALYDASLHRAASVLEARGVPVVVDDGDALFAAASELPAALYCGWYSLGKYVDAFAWKRGAVGYHIASSECTTLHRKESTVWCKRMLEEGIAATLGPVGEPYLQAFPPPHLFFPLLLEGGRTLSEAYSLSLPYLSWKMVLIGDPLYRPRFRKAVD